MSSLVRYQVAMAEALLGRRGEAVTRINKSIEDAQKEESQISLGRALVTRAAVYAALGDAGKALDDLERAWKLPILTSGQSLRTDWRFASLAGNPRFQRLVNGE